MWRSVKGVIVGALLVLSLALTAAAQEQQHPVNNVFLDTDLRQALQDVAAQAKVNIIADPSVQGVVSVELKDASVEEALGLLLAGTGYLYTRKSNYYLVFTPDQTTGDFTSVADTKVVRVRNVSADEARKLLPDMLQRYVRVGDTSDALAITAPKVLLDRILLDLAKIDTPSGEETYFVPLNHVKAATARTLLSVDLQRFVRTDNDRNTLAITAPHSTVQKILKQIAALDLPRLPGAFDVPNVYPTQLVKLNYATAKSAMALLPKPVQAFVQADDDTNALAVSAPDYMVAGILASIGAIDVPRKQVLLSARVVALERGDLLNLGGSWTWPTISAATVISDAVKWPWELRVGYTPDREFTNALSLTLNLLSQNNEATIISNPQVMAEDGKEAADQGDDGGVLPAHGAERHHLRADRTAADRDRDDPRHHAAHRRQRRPHPRHEHRGQRRHRPRRAEPAGGQPADGEEHGPHPQRRHRRDRRPGRYAHAARPLGRSRRRRPAAARACLPHRQARSPGAPGGDLRHRHHRQSGRGPGGDGQKEEAARGAGHGRRRLPRRTGGGTGPAGGAEAMSATGKAGRVALVLGLAAMLLSGCAGAINQSVILADQAVTPITDGTATWVSPETLAEAMLRAGFTRDEILELGPQVGRALATAGGAQVRRGKAVAALFAVNDSSLIVTSTSRGTFVQPLS